MFNQDLPDEIKEILKTPCSTCGEIGIHECKYDDNKVIERLEIMEKNKKILSPEKIKKKRKPYNPNSKNRIVKKPSIGNECKDCKQIKQTKDGICIDCTHKKRELAKNKPIVLKDRWGNPKNPHYKFR